MSLFFTIFSVMVEMADGRHPEWNTLKCHSSRQYVCSREKPQTLARLGRTTKNPAFDSLIIYV